jgi:hypothetical protein
MDSSTSVDGQVGSTHSANLAASPPPAPYSDRSQNNDPPLIPPTSGGKPSEIKQARKRPSPDTVLRVLQYFLARLWPGATSTPLTRKRRRLVEARLRELETDDATAEQVLVDAIDGAPMHPWHRIANTGYFAEKIFRDADTVETLAKLGRARRLRAERTNTRTVTTPITAPRPILARPISAISPGEMEADLARLFGRGFVGRTTARR